LELQVAAQRSVSPALSVAIRTPNRADKMRRAPPLTNRRSASLSTAPRSRSWLWVAVTTCPGLALGPKSNIACLDRQDWKLLLSGPSAKEKQ
jgi:hypothetical protein